MDVTKHKNNINPKSGLCAVQLIVFFIISRCTDIVYHICYMHDISNHNPGTLIPHPTQHRKPRPNTKPHPTTSTHKETGLNRGEML